MCPRVNKIDYKIIGIGPCLADGSQFRVTALLSGDITELMPYLNASMKFCAYEPFVPVLTLKCKGSPVVLHPDRAIAGKLREVDDAEEILDALVDFINRVEDQKERLRPEHLPKELPQPMEIYPLLPRTDCGACGEKTCLAFIVQLVKGEKAAEGCPHLTPVQAGKIYEILGEMDESGVLFTDSPQQAAE